MARHYDEDYHRSISKAGETNPAERWLWANKLISQYMQSGSILDIGCSSGAFLKAMQTPSWKLYGIDMEASTAEQARASTGADIFVGDAADAPFAPESLDVVTNFDLIEHVYDPVRLMKKVREWLKVGGIYVAQVPNIDSWEARFFGSNWYGLELPRHLFHFSPRSIRSLMASTGMEEVSLKTPAISYAEASLHYAYLRMIEKLGFSVVPPAKTRVYGLGFRVVRKAFRMTVLKFYCELSAIAKVGPSIVLVFRKT